MAGLRWRRLLRRRGVDVVVVALGAVVFVIAAAVVGWALLHSGR